MGVQAIGSQLLHPALTPNGGKDVGLPMDMSWRITSEPQGKDTRWEAAPNRRRSVKMDMVYVLVTVLFFVLCMLYVAFLSQEER